MNTIEPGPEFYQVFTPDVTGRLFAAIRRGYETALEGRMSAERGYNEQMFGFTLAGYNVHELTAEIETAGAPFALVPQGNTFRFRVSGYEVGCYRAGKSDRESIWGAFPDNDSGIQTLANDQLWLPGMEPRELPKLVLAHLGNAEEGLCALYLCAPKRFERGQVAEWAFAEPIWKRANEDTVLAPITSTHTKAPVEEIGLPLFRRKPRKEDDQGNG